MDVLLQILLFQSTKGVRRRVLGASARQQKFQNETSFALSSPIGEKGLSEAH